MVGGGDLRSPPDRGDGGGRGARSRGGGRGSVSGEDAGGRGLLSSDSAGGHGSGGRKTDRGGGGALSDRWAGAVEDAMEGVTGSISGFVAGEAGSDFVPCDGGGSADDRPRSDMGADFWSDVDGNGGNGEVLVALADGTQGGQRALSRPGSDPAGGDGEDQTMTPAVECVSASSPTGDLAAKGNGVSAAGNVTNIYRSMAEENQRRVEEIRARNRAAGLGDGGASPKNNLHTTVDVNMQECSHANLGGSGSATGRGFDFHAPGNDKSAPVERPSGVRWNAAEPNAPQNRSAWNQPRIVRFSSAEEEDWEQMPPDRAVMDEEAMEYNRDKLEFALIGKIWGKSFSFAHLAADLSRRWGRFGRIRLLSASSDCFVCLFESEEARDAVLMGGPWTFNGQVIGMDKWVSSSMKVNLDNLVSPIWVRFPGLPLLFWDRKNIGRIASRIGHPIGMDYPTSDWSRCSFARVCIRMNLSKPLPKGVMVVGPKGDFFQRVEYEGISSLCFNCGSVGHKVMSCPHVTTVPAADSSASDLPPSVVPIASGSVPRPPMDPPTMASAQVGLGVSASDANESAYGPWMLVRPRRPPPRSSMKAAHPVRPPGVNVPRPSPRPPGPTAPLPVPEAGKSSLSPLAAKPLAATKEPSANAAPSLSSNPCTAIMKDVCKAFAPNKTSSMVQLSSTEQPMEEPGFFPTASPPPDEFTFGKGMPIAKEKGASSSTRVTRSKKTPTSRGAGIGTTVLIAEGSSKKKRRGCAVDAAGGDASPLVTT